MAPEEMIEAVRKLPIEPFARFEPYRDGREVIARRGSQLGYDYGPDYGTRTCVVDGASIPLTRYRSMLSPPLLRPGQTPLRPGAIANYTHESEVARWPDLALLIGRSPNGFTDREVTEIVTAFQRAGRQAG